MNTIRRFSALTAILALLVLAAGCSDRNPAELEVARGDNNPVVFDDDYSEIVYFQPFFETHYEAVSIDSVYAYNGFSYDGDRSLRFNVPPPNSALGPYMGGVLTSAGARDLADYNALTFYARACTPVTLDLVGFGNDNTGTSLYEAARSNIALTEEWAFVIVPIPAPSRMISERGLFTIAESFEDQAAACPDGYNIYIDEIKYAKLGNIEPFRPTMKVEYMNTFVGAKIVAGDTYTIFYVDGAPVIVGHSPYYFDYVSSDSTVAMPTEGGAVAVGPGTARITGLLEVPDYPDSNLGVFGWVDVEVYAPIDEAAAAPTFPAGDVVSLFSASYVDIPVDTWRADWSSAGYQEFVVGGVRTKMYTGLGYTSILHHERPVDTTDLTHFHLDAYAPTGTDLTIKLSCVPGPEWTNQVPPQVVVNLDATTTPAFVSGQWSNLDIPLADFVPDAGVTADDFDWTAVNELVISTGPSADTKMLLVDNVLYRK